MPKFDASTAVEAMEYDFTAFGGDKGTIPEPSTGQVESFFQGLRNIAKSMKDEIREKTGMDMADIPEDASQIKDDATRKRLLEALDSLGDDTMSKQQGAMASLVANLCSDRPSVDDLNRLPFRVFSEFQKWLMGEIRPNQAAPATKR